MHKTLVSSLIIASAVLSGMTCIEKTKFESVKYEVQNCFKSAVISNLRYLQTSGEVCVNYQEYQKDFKLSISSFKNVQILESSNILSPNYIYPVYADGVGELIEIYSGMLSKKFYLTSVITKGGCVNETEI